MIRSLLLFLIFFGYAGVGLFVPFIAALGYVWVDLMRPQQLAYSILPSVPVSLILFCVMVLSYVVFDRRNPPRITGLMVLLVVFALWVSATLLWAQHPSDAFAKWDWAIKVLIFAVFVPFIIRSRIQIEAFMLTYLFAVSGVAITYGIKTAVTGGGFYGHNYGFNFGNSGLGESSHHVHCLCDVDPDHFLHGQTFAYPSWLAVAEIYGNRFGGALYVGDYRLACAHRFGCDRRR